MAVGINAQATVATSSGAVSLTTGALSPGSVFGGLLFVVVTGARMATVSIPGVGGLTRRWSFNGPNSLYMELWYLPSPPPQSFTVSGTVSGAVPTNWGMGAYAVSPTDPIAWDPTSSVPFPTAGGGKAVLAPYFTSTPIDLALVLVANNNTGVASGPGMWTPLSTVTAGTQSMTPFVASVNQGSGNFVGAMSPDGIQWLVVSDAILGIPPSPASPSPMQTCSGGPMAAANLPTAPAAVAAGTTVAPANAYNRCDAVYYKPNGASASGP